MSTNVVSLTERRYQHSLCRNIRRQVVEDAQRNIKSTPIRDARESATAAEWPTPKHFDWLGWLPIGAALLVLLITLAMGAI